MTRVTVNGVSSKPTRAFEIIRSAAEAYLSSGQPSRVYVSADRLRAWLAAPGKRPPVVVDIRTSDAYTHGHIPGTVNVPWQQVLETDNLTHLPNDRAIVLVGDNGHMESRLALVLNMLGYDARVLRFGLASWTRNRDVAPKRFDQRAMAAGYPVESTPVALPSPGPLPALESDVDNARSTILAAARACLIQGKPDEIRVEALFARMTSELDRSPLVLSVRKPEHYALGHVPGAPNFYYAESARLDRLRCLPAERPIAIYCYVGHSSNQTAMLLQMLGYQATNLTWGLASWTPDESVAMAAFKESEDARDYPLET
ncbi:MAG: Thiosulfate sulfurtransferase GlpE [Anaerolineales bacterium]|nr:Thiosulfate sulfurtransferase GlpE [Anaerolineales bacterium]